VYVRNLEHLARTPICTFFTVHDAEKDEEFFRSEVAFSSLNPAFHINEAEENFRGYNNNYGRICIRLWRAYDGEAVAGGSPLIVRKMDLRKLIPLDSRNLHDFKFAANSIVLSIGGELFTTRTVKDFGEAEAESVGEATMQELAIPARTAPSKNSIIRARDTVLSCLRNIEGHYRLKSLDKTLSGLSKEVSKILRRHTGDTDEARLKENLVVLLKQLVEDFDYESGKAEKIRAMLASHRRAIGSRPESVKMSTKTLQQYRRLIEERSKDLAAKKDEVQDLQLRMQTRRAKMLSQIQSIYPISVPVSTHQGYYVIRDIRIPTTNVLAEDEENISSALGYVCHILILLSKYLEIPLRYRIHYRASRSYISDEISPIGSNQYPLYFRGVDKEKYECGVILLNRIVDQILSCRNIEMVGSQIRLDNPSRLLENLARFFISEVP